MFGKLKEIILNIINKEPCPFDLYDNPFPQWCDKRIMFTKECKECAWRKKNED